MTPLVADLDGLLDDLLGPLRLPRHPRAAARFALPGLRSAAGLAHARFEGERARALLAGNAAHSMQPLERPATAAFGLVLLLLGHGIGWPVAAGGSQAIADALASLLRSLGGELETGVEVRALDELAAARSVLFDLSPRQLLRSRATRSRSATAARSRASVTARGSSSSTTRSTGRSRGARPSAGAPGPCTWEERSRRSRGPRPRSHAGCTRSGPSCSSRSRACSIRAGRPQGAHTLWAYCHVPNGSRTDMTEAIEQQIERFAPGFRELVRARHAHGAGRAAGAQRELRRR